MKKGLLDSVTGDFKFHNTAQQNHQEVHQNKISSFKFPNWTECLITINPLIWFPIEHNSEEQVQIVQG